MRNAANYSEVVKEILDQEFVCFFNMVATHYRVELNLFTDRSSNETINTFFNDKFIMGRLQFRSLQTRKYISMNS